MIAAALEHVPVTPSALWRAWSFDPSVIVGLIAGAIAYGRGFRTLRRRATVDRRAAALERRAAAFGAGLVVLAIALVSPLDRLAEALFSAHMVQHLLLVVVAAPLLVTARPVRTALAGLSAPTRRAAARAVRAIDATRVTRALRRPAVAWTVLTLGLWSWHTPSLYTSALESTALHAVEHSCFLLTSMLGWSVALHGRTRESVGAFGRALFLLASAVQSALLGALLLFASTPLFPVHGLGPALWSLTPLQDQQLAGALMWIPPSAVYLGVAAALLIRSFRSMDAEDRTERAGARVAA